MLRFQIFLAAFFIGSSVASAGLSRSGDPSAEQRIQLCYGHKYGIEAREREWVERGYVTEEGLAHVRSRAQWFAAGLSFIRYQERAGDPRIGLHRAYLRDQLLMDLQIQSIQPLPREPDYATLERMLITLNGIIASAEATRAERDMLARDLGLNRVQYSELGCQNLGILINGPASSPNLLVQRIQAALAQGATSPLPTRSAPDPTDLLNVELGNPSQRPPATIESAPPARTVAPGPGPLPATPVSSAAISHVFASPGDPSIQPSGFRFPASGGVHVWGQTATEALRLGRAACFRVESGGDESRSCRCSEGVDGEIQSNGQRVLLLRLSGPRACSGSSPLAPAQGSCSEMRAHLGRLADRGIAALSARNNGTGTQAGVDAAEAEARSYAAQMQARGCNPWDLSR